MSAPGGVFRNKRWQIVAIVAGVLVMGGLGIYFTAPREPSYQGQKLSWWIGEYEQKQKDGGAWDSDPFAQESENALRAIGIDAIPTLLRWMEKSDSPVRNKINLLLDRQRLISFRFERPYRKWHLAYEGFSFVGGKALFTVPALTRIVESTSNYYQREDAFASILDIAREKKLMLPVIVQGLQRKDDLRLAAACYVYQTHPEQGEALGIYEVMPKLRVFAAKGITNNILSQYK